MLPPIEKLAAIIKAAAQEELVPRFAHVERSLKRDGSIVTEADMAMQMRLERTLNENWPDLSLLGEEMSGQQQQSLLDGPGLGLWLLDPLDGTSNFAAGIPYFSVSLALIRDGQVVLGLIYDPLRDECFAAVQGEGASLNGVPLKVAEDVPTLDHSMGLIDFKRLDGELAQRLAIDPPYASQRSFGSGALDWCMVASGRCHLYLHGAQKLWDYAAGQLILAEAGGRSTTLSGEPVFTPSLAPRSIVAATTTDLCGTWMRWLEGQ